METILLTAILLLIVFILYVVGIKMQTNSKESRFYDRKIDEVYSEIEEDERGSEMDLAK